MTREEAAEAIRKAGGKVTNSVSKNTSFLLVGKNPGQRKPRRKTEILGVPQLTEDRFLAMLNLRPQQKSEQQQHFL